MLVLFPLTWASERKEKRKYLIINDSKILGVREGYDKKKKLERMTLRHTKKMISSQLRRLRQGRKWVWFMDEKGFPDLEVSRLKKKKNRREHEGRGRVMYPKQPANGAECLAATVAESREAGEEGFELHVTRW